MSKENGHAETEREVTMELRPRPTPEGISEEERRLHELPVDRGWAWVISFAGFMTYYMMGVGNQATFVMFLKIVERYDTDITTASLIFTGIILSLSVSSVVGTNFVLPRIGEKGMVTASGLMVSTSALIYHAAPNIWVFIAAACLNGIGSGCAFVSSLNLIQHYFHKRRFLATTLANVGTSVAEITVPPVISALSSHYGVRGTYLIVAAVQLHMVAAGLLMRPIDTYKYRPVLAPLKRKRFQKKNKKGANGDIVSGEDGEIDAMKMNGKTEEQMETTQKLLSKENKAEVRRDEEKQNGTVKVEEEDAEESLDELRRYASAMSLSDEPAPPAAVLAANQSEQEESKTKRCWDRINNSVFGLWTFRLLLVSTIPCGVNHYIRLYVPTVARSQGATMDQAALVVTVMGSVALVSRLFVGWFADTHILKPSQILVITQIGLGLLCQFIRFFNTFGTLVLMGVGLGLFIGTRLTLSPMLSLEVAGLARLPQAFSILATVHTLAGAAVNPIFGAVVEVTGSFVLVLHISGACLIIGSLLMLPLPLMARMDIKAGKRKPDQ